MLPRATTNNIADGCQRYIVSIGNALHRLVTGSVERSDSNDFAFREFSRWAITSAQRVAMSVNYGIPVVVGWVASIKVRRVDAFLVTASMQYPSPFWPRSISEFIREDVHRNGLIVNGQPSVSVSKPAKPRPAFVWFTFVNVGPKAIFGGSSSMSRTVCEMLSLAIIDAVLFLIPVRYWRFLTAATSAQSVSFSQRRISSSFSSHSAPSDNRLCGHYTMKTAASKTA